MWQMNLNRSILKVSLKAMKIENTKNNMIFDKVGQAIAVICAVHCFLFPFMFPVLAFLPFVSSVLENTLMSVAVLIATVSMIHAIKHKKNAGVVRLFILGFVLFAAHILTHDGHHHGLDVFVVGGSACMGIAHLLNRKCNHTCSN